MLATVALSVAFLAKPSFTPPQNQGGQLISKMLKAYSDADSMTGTITLTAGDGQGKVQVVTTLNYEKPSLLYIKQSKGGQNPQTWLTISNGTWFSYDMPPTLATSSQFLGGIGKDKRLTESVKQIVPGEFVKDQNGKKQAKTQNYDIRQIYAIGAVSLGDRSVPLDIAIARPEDLAHDNLTWMTSQLLGKATVNGVEANIVSGKWRPYGDGRLFTNIESNRSTYEMAITDDGKLVRYTISQPIDNGPTLTMVWDVNLQINGKPDPKIFTGKSS